jgi:hypothetical protein
MRILQDCMEYDSHSTNVILDSQFITEIHTCMFENKPDVTYEEDDKYNQYFGKNCVLLGYYTATSSNLLQTFRSLV